MKNGNHSIHPFVERRTAKRSVLLSRNLILAYLILEGDNREKSCQYININDVSPYGIRILADQPLPARAKVKLRLNLQDAVVLEARTVWCREIEGKRYQVGMKFINNSDINLWGIPALLSWAQPFFGKKSFRVNAPLSFYADFQEKKKTFPAYVIVISPRGMEMRSTFPFPEQGDFILSFNLHAKIQPISARAAVIFQRKVKPLFDEDYLAEFFKIWIEFFDNNIVMNHITEAQRYDPLFKC